MIMDHQINPPFCQWDPQQLIQSNSCLLPSKSNQHNHSLNHKFKAYILINLHRKNPTPTQYTLSQTINIWLAKTRRNKKCSQANHRILTCRPIDLCSFFYRIKIFHHQNHLHQHHFQTQKMFSFRNTTSSQAGACQKKKRNSNQKFSLGSIEQKKESKEQIRKGKRYEQLQERINQVRVRSVGLILKKLVKKRKQGGLKRLKQGM